MLLLSTKKLEASLTNSVDPDQTVWSGSTLFASILMLTNKDIFGSSYFAGVLRVKPNVLCLYRLY